MSELINNKDNHMEIDSDDEDNIGLKSGGAGGGVEDNVTTNEPEEDTSLNNPDVVTKYQEAAKIVQSALVEIIAKCIPGSKIVDICRFGDELIEAKTKAIYKNKNKAGKFILKGVAFPVCISVNEFVCHCSPLETEEGFAPLAVNDSVKVDMGAHIDGYIVLAAHTFLVGVDVKDPAVAVGLISDKRAHVINAAYTAAEVATRLIKAGNTNHQVTQAMKAVAELFEVNPVSGTVMHQMKQYVIDGKKLIVLKEEPDQAKSEKCSFETGEVYAIDIAMSSGEGRPRDVGSRTTVYKRAVEKKYLLKSKSSRAFFNDVNKTFPTLPFSIRSLPDERAAKLGVRECVNHGLLTPYPVLQEKSGDYIAHIKFTVLLLPSGTLQISGLPPFTYDAMVSAGLTATTAEETPLMMNGNIARILCDQLLKDRTTSANASAANASGGNSTAAAVVIPDDLLSVLNEVKEVKVKKNKTKKGASKAVVVEAEA